MTRLADVNFLGILPAQDHTPNRPEKFGTRMMAVRITDRDPERTNLQYQVDRETFGDIQPMFFWPPESGSGDGGGDAGGAEGVGSDSGGTPATGPHTNPRNLAGGRDAPSGGGGGGGKGRYFGIWYPGPIVAKVTSSKKEETRQKSGRQPDAHPTRGTVVRNPGTETIPGKFGVRPVKEGWEADDRLAELSPELPEDVNQPPEDSYVIVLPGTETDRQVELAIPVGERLVAHHREDDPPDRSSSVYDVDGKKLSEDYKAGLHTMMRVLLPVEGQDREQQLPPPEIHGRRTHARNRTGPTITIEGESADAPAIAWNTTKSEGDETGWGLVLGAFAPPGEQEVETGQKSTLFERFPELEELDGRLGRNFAVDRGADGSVQVTNWVSGGGGNNPRSQPRDAAAGTSNQGNWRRTIQRRIPPEQTEEPDQGQSEPAKSGLVAGYAGWERGGMIHPGSPNDQHKHGKTEDGIPVNAAHLYSAVPVFGPLGRDAPLDIEEADEPDDVREGSTPYRVRCQVNAKEIHLWARDKIGTGKRMWHVKLPISDTTTGGPLESGASPGCVSVPQEEPIARLPGDDVYGGPRSTVPRTNPYRPGRHMIGSAHEWSSPALLFKPSPVYNANRFSTDLRNDPFASAGQVQNWFKNTPAVARMEAFGHEHGRGEFESYDEHGNPRYLCGGVTGGGIVVLPPDTGMEDWTDGFLPGGGESELPCTVFGLLKERTCFVIGTPSPPTGRMVDGWHIGMEEGSDDLHIDHVDEDGNQDSIGDVVVNGSPLTGDPSGPDVVVEPGDDVATALASCPDNGWIHFKAGDHAIPDGGLSFSTNGTHITGPDATFLNTTAPGDAEFYVASHGVTIDGIIFDGVRLKLDRSGAGGGVLTYPTLTRLKFQNTTYGLEIAGAGIQWGVLTQLRFETSCTAGWTIGPLIDSYLAHWTIRIPGDAGNDTEILGCERVVIDNLIQPADRTAGNACLQIKETASLTEVALDTVIRDCYFAGHSASGHGIHVGESAGTKPLERVRIVGNRFGNGFGATEDLIRMENSGSNRSVWVGENTSEPTHSGQHVKATGGGSWIRCGVGQNFWDTSTPQIDIEGTGASDWEQAGYHSTQLRIKYAKKRTDTAFSIDYDDGAGGTTPAVADWIGSWFDFDDQIDPAGFRCRGIYVTYGGDSGTTPGDVSSDSEMLALRSRAKRGYDIRATDLGSPSFDTADRIWAEVDHAGATIGGAIVWKGVRMLPPPEGSGTVRPLEVVRQEEGEWARFSDGTNVHRRFLVSSDPNGSLTAEQGSIALDPTAPAIWINRDGGTNWSRFGGYPTRWLVGAVSSWQSASTASIGTAGEDYQLRSHDDTSDTSGTGVIGTTDITVTGADGLDTGTVAADTFYYHFVIWDSTGANADATLFSTSRTAPTLPVGYDSFRRVGTYITDSSSNLIEQVSAGSHLIRRVIYEDNISNRVLLSGGAATAWTAVSASSYVPPHATRASFRFRETGTQNLRIARQTGGPPIEEILANGSELFIDEFITDSSQQVFYRHPAGGGSADIAVLGYFDDLE